MPNPLPQEPIVDDVPWSEGLTAYDQAHLIVYLRLLDAAADGATADEMARVVLGIDPREEPQRAQKSLASHLRRARWMTEHGFKHLLEPRT